VSTLSLNGVFAGVLAGADATFEPGLNVVLGAPRDGTDTLARLFSGIERPRRGTALVAGTAPWTTPSTRARVGALLSDEPAADASSFHALVSRVQALRGDPGDARSLLAEHGLEGVAGSRPDRATPEVRRHVALALALSVREPLALVLHEPFAVGPRAVRARTRTALVEAAAAGVAVLVLTASPRDASELGGRVVLLDGGRFVRRPGPVLATELAPGRGIVLRVRASTVRALVASLAQESAVASVEWDAQLAEDEVTVRGPDADAVALAVLRAVRATGAELRAIEPVLPALDVARVATQGLWRATYEAAYRAAQQQARPAAEPSSRVIARTAAISPSAPPAAAPEAPTDAPTADEPAPGEEPK